MIKPSDYFVWQLALFSIGALFALMLIIPACSDVKYRVRVYTNRKRFPGIKMPQTRYQPPFGLKQFIGLCIAIKNQRFPHYIYDQALKEERLTGRREMLGQYVFWTVDPENIKAVLATQFKDFCLGRRHEALYPLLGDGIFTLDSSGWQHSRAMLRPQFTREQISHVESIERHLVKLINTVKETSQSGYVDIQKLFFDLTIDTATEFLFGESVDILSGGNPRIPEALEFGNAFNRAQHELAFRLVAQDYYGLFNSKQMRRDCQLCKDFTASYVKLAIDRYSANEDKKSQPNSYIFLDELTKETRDPETLRNQALNILLAGRDTTASLLSFIFKELSLHPEVYARLRKEIIDTFGDGTNTEGITFESLKRCVYLRHVVNETLRLYPTVPNNFRQAVCDTTLPVGGGPDGQSPIFVPKGSYVHYSVFNMHRHPKIWGPDATVWDPSRWERQQPGERHHWDFLPFNGGPRICLGQQFALTETSYTVVRLLQTFERLEKKPGLFEGEEKVNAALTMSVGGNDGVAVRMY